MLNAHYFMGRFCREPELKTTNNGTSVCSFTLAVDRDYSKEEKQVDFLNFVAWKQTAEFISRYFNKGSLILVECRAETRSWEKDGQKREVVEFIVNKAHFCGEKKNDSKTVYDEGKPSAKPTPEIDFKDEGLPF